MTLHRDEVGKGLVSELEAFGRLVRTLSEEEAQTASRCEGWTVADVAAHVIGTMADITQGRIEGQGTPEVTERQVVERRGHAPADLAAELDTALEVVPSLLAAFDDDAWASPSPGGYDFTLGHAVEALWYDAYVHAEDIRAALGRPSERGDGLRASAFHVADLLDARGWGPARLVLDGVGEVAVGEPGGGAPTYTADALAFVLAATGRADPAATGLPRDVNVYA